VLDARGGGVETQHVALPDIDARVVVDEVDRVHLVEEARLG
jgi:hypothetical protein